MRIFLVHTMGHADLDKTIINRGGATSALSCSRPAAGQIEDSIAGDYARIA